MNNTGESHGNTQNFLCCMSAGLSALQREGIWRRNKRYYFIKSGFLFLKSGHSSILPLLENTARIFSRNVYFGRQRKFGRIIYDIKTGAAKVWQVNWVKTAHALGHVCNIMIFRRLGKMAFLWLEPRSD
ncbi:MAG: hypothetical protein PHC61_09435 [Chitinivibrionales bacterium]|nr:hypothetical protein [Chitinivibrionales bacterium]